MLSWFLSFAVTPLFGQETAESAAFDNNIDRTDPNFVKASLLVFGPGEQLYSCAGHVAFRLECPTYDLDYVFSYEGESVSDQIFKFFAGKLKMGMFAVPASDFLNQYVTSGRGCKQYNLNLPPLVKIRLWKSFDDLVAKGADLPYDYIKRGCAQSTLHTLMAAIHPDKVTVDDWPDKFSHSRRELLHSYIADFPWTRIMLHMISGPEADLAPRMIDKIITPDDMLDYLCRVKIGNERILTEEPVEILPQTLNSDGCVITPMLVALMFVVLSVVTIFRPMKTVEWIMLMVQTIIGLAESYIVMISELPASDWNWLLIPFNPLPLIFWHWRRYWALPFIIILSAWEAYMLFNGHILTDPAFLVLTFAYIVFYLQFFCGFKVKNFDLGTEDSGRARTPSAPQKGAAA